MTYCAKADLLARFGTREVDDLLDQDNDGTEDTGRLDGAIADACALIDGYLAARYTVPIPAPVPTLVVAIACDLVRFKLWDDHAPDEVRKRYDDALRQLRDLASGLLSLPSAPVATTSGGGAEYSAPDRLFTLDTLSRF